MRADRNQIFKAIIRHGRTKKKWDRVRGFYYIHEIRIYLYINGCKRILIASPSPIFSRATVQSSHSHN